MTLHSVWMVVKNHFYESIQTLKYVLISGLKVNDKKTQVVWIGS